MPIPRRGRGLSLRTLIILRWLAIIGQTSAVLVAVFRLEFPLPLWPCLLVITTSVAMNLWATSRLQRMDSREPEANRTALQMGFDIIQLSSLLALTGGLENPFCLLLMAPVTIAAAALPTRQAVLLGMLALAATAMLFFWSNPLPWRNDADIRLPALYRLGMGLALGTGVIFTAGYAWRVATDAEKLELALATTQDVLQREQRLAALGGLAAAAAHELGTPLATIQVVSKELLRASPPDSATAEDARLLLSQAERCREILKRLSQRPDEPDALYADVTLKQLLEEVVDPHRGFDLSMSIRIVGAGGSGPRIKRLPEIIHGLSAIVENAADFANSWVRIEGLVESEVIEIRVVDDGPGFSAEVLPRLGEPYVTSRPQAKARRALAAQILATTDRARERDKAKGKKAKGKKGDGVGLFDDAISPVPNAPETHAPTQGGMGLGFFIARTLLERTGGRVSVGLGDGGPGQPKGARVSVRWPRTRLAPSDLNPPI